LACGYGETVACGGEAYDDDVSCSDISSSGTLSMLGSCSGQSASYVLG
jgi:hypothetical protein